MMMEGEFRIVQDAVEVTQASLFVIQDLHLIREFCEKELERFTAIRDRLREDDEFRQKNFDDDLNPHDPGHANWKPLLFGGYHHAQVEVLGHWFSAMPPCVERLESQLAWIDDKLKRFGENGRNAIQTFLSRRQLPQRWRGFMPCAWDISVVVKVARDVTEALRESFEALPEDWQARDPLDANCRTMIRGGVWSAIHGAELVLRHIGSEAELKTLEGEVARDDYELKTLEGSMVSAKGELHRSVIGESPSVTRSSAEYCGRLRMVRSQKQAWLARLDRSSVAGLSTVEGWRSGDDV